MSAADGFDAARHRMVEKQIAARGIRDPRVLEAMRTVPRHRFVGAAHRDEAYTDQPLPIGFGQTISQPYIVAYMVEQLQLPASGRVLEVGAGCGYETAVLARVAQAVYAVEIVEPLAQRASETLAELGVTNAEVKAGDGYGGWLEHAPFDGIIVAAAPLEIPAPLIEQLSQGGRLIVPVGCEIQELIVLTRSAEGVSEERLLPVRFVPLTRSPVTGV